MITVLHEVAKQDYNTEEQQIIDIFLNKFNVDDLRIVKLHWLPDCYKVTQIGSYPIKVIKENMTIQFNYNNSNNVLVYEYELTPGFVCQTLTEAIYSCVQYTLSTQKDRIDKVLNNIPINPFED